jgi:hypothetical protein
MWTVQGQVTGTGVFTLTDYGPSMDACGNTVGPITSTATVTITSCSSAQATGTGSSGSNPGFKKHTLPLAKSTTVTWTRTSNPAGITVTLDIMGGKITSQLTGQQKTNNLNVAVYNSGGSQTLSTTHNSAQAGNSFSDSFRTQLTVGQYGSVTATWDTTTVTVPVSFYMLGATHFTQYNTPYHSACTTTQVPVLIINKMDAQNCYYQDATLGAPFAASVAQNGTGVVDTTTPNLVLKAYAAGAMRICPLYPGFDGQHTFFAVDTGGNTITKITGTHNKVLSDASGAGSVLNNANPPPGSIATDPLATNAGSPPIYLFDDSILLFDQNDRNDAKGIRAVEDLCPACSGQGQQTSSASAHIDMYNATSTSCSARAVGDYGQYNAIRLR